MHAEYFEILDTLKAQEDAIFGTKIDSNIFINLVIFKLE